MKAFELTLPKGASEREIVERFESVIDRCGLTVASRGTLKTLPGSVHWHLKSGNRSGTLEATLDFAKGSFQLTYHENRKADWFAEAIPSVLDAWKNKGGSSR